MLFHYASLMLQSMLYIFGNYQFVRIHSLYLIMRYKNVDKKNPSQILELCPLGTVMSKKISFMEMMAKS